MEPMIDIAAAHAVRAEDALALDALLATVPPRSPKAGMLAPPARLLLHVASHCLDPQHGATRQAAPDAGAGLSLGTRWGAHDVARRSLLAVRAQGVAGLVPSWYAGGLANASGASVASTCGLGGPNLTFLGRHAGIEAIADACRCLRRGRADAMLAGGFDLITDEEGRPRHGAAALLQLRRHDERATATLGRIVGWSESCGEGSDAFDTQAALDRLVAQAMGSTRGTPELTCLRARDDTLAADAVHALVAQLQEGAGLHAWVALDGRRAHCVIVDVARPMA